MFGDQLRIGVINDPRDFRLTLSIGKEDVRSRKRDHFNIDPDAVHIRDSLRHVSHRRRYPEEPGAAIGDDCLTARTFIEREFRRQLADLVEIDWRVVMRMQIELPRGHEGVMRPVGSQSRDWFSLVEINTGGLLAPASW